MRVRLRNFCLQAKDQAFCLSTVFRGQPNTGSNELILGLSGQVTGFGHNLKKKPRLRPGLYKSRFLLTLKKLKTNYYLFQKTVESFPPGRMFQLTECLCLDLPDTLTGKAEHFADLFEGVVRLFSNAEAHPDDLFLSRGERRQDLVDLFLAGRYRRVR